MRLVEVTEHLARGCAHHEVQPGEDRLADPRRVVERRRTHRLLQDVLHPLAHLGRVPVAGQEDEARQVAAVGVAADEEAQLPALPQMQDGLGDRKQLLDRGLEQLVARVVLEDVDERLAAVAQRLEARPLEQLGRLVPQDRDADQALGVGGRAEQPEEPLLAVDLAGGVEGLDPDIVEVDRPVDRRPRVRLRDDQQLLFPRLRAHGGRQPSGGRRHVLVGPEDPQPGARHRPEHVLAVDGLELVLPVAEKGEVVVGQPLQQRPALPDLGRRQRRWRLLEIRDDLPRLGVHLLPVLDHLAYVTEHVGEGLPDLLECCRVGLAVDLDVHPGLADQVARCLGVCCLLGVAHVEQGTGDVAADQELGVDDHMDRAVLCAQGHGDRVDQERHVVGDDLDHGMAGRRPLVVVDRRCEHAYGRRTLRPHRGQLVVAQGRAVDVGSTAVQQVLGIGVPVVGIEQVARLVTVQRDARSLATLGDGGCVGEELLLRDVQLAEHEHDTCFALRDDASWAS